MIICEVLHGGGRYVFSSKYNLQKDQYVLCDTRYGKAHGIVKECFEVTDTESVLYRRYLELMGAREPLKEIVGVYVPFELIETGKRKRNEE